MLSDIGIVPSDENMHGIVEWLYEGIKSEGDEETVKQKLTDAVMLICK